MGLQYTPLRYAILPGAIVLGHRLVQAVIQGSFGWLLASAIVTASNRRLLSDFARDGNRRYGRFYLQRGGLFLGAQNRPGFRLPARERFSPWPWWRVSPPATFTAIISFGSGAYNFPVYPNLVNLMFVSAYIFVLPKIACSIWQQPSDPGPRPSRPVLGPPPPASSPPPSGAAIRGHVLFNGLLVFILLFCAFAQIKRSLLITWGLRLWVCLYPSGTNFLLGPLLGICGRKRFRNMTFTRRIQAWLRSGHRTGTTSERDREIIRGSIGTRWFPFLISIKRSLYHPRGSVHRSKEISCSIDISKFATRLYPNTIRQDAPSSLPRKMCGAESKTLARSMIT